MSYVISNKDATLLAEMIVADLDSVEGVDLPQDEDNREGLVSIAANSIAGTVLGED